MVRKDEVQPDVRLSCNCCVACSKHRPTLACSQDPGFRRQLFARICKVGAAIESALGSAQVRRYSAPQHCAAYLPFAVPEYSALEAVCACVWMDHEWLVLVPCSCRHARSSPGAGYRIVGTKAAMSLWLWRVRETKSGKLQHPDHCCFKR
jgi:hypothetical protein